MPRPVRERIVVAMSGGVDSSLTAALLRDAGHDLVGMTLRLHTAAGDGADAAACGSSSAEETARCAAAQLGIEHHVVDGCDAFTRLVLTPCWLAYKNGRTPNPCVLCNQELKFGALWRAAAALGASALATGHYARIESDASGRLCLLRGRDPKKDQSYFLHALSAEQLARARFPLGGLTKEEVREQARARGLTSAARPDSQDACMTTGDLGLGESLRQRFHDVSVAGDVVDTAGHVVGRHQGVHTVTIGQRRGLFVALGQRAFVSRIEPAAARVVVSTEERDLLAAGLVVEQLHRLAPAWPPRCEVQIRYRHHAVPAAIEPDADGERLRIWFDEPQRAVTPGQAAVLYDGERVLGGGCIAAALANGASR